MHPLGSLIQQIQFPLLRVCLFFLTFSQPLQESFSVLADAGAGRLESVPAFIKRLPQLSGGRAQQLVLSLLVQIQILHSLHIFVQTVILIIFVLFETTFVLAVPALSPLPTAGKAF